MSYKILKLVYTLFDPLFKRIKIFQFNMNTKDACIGRIGGKYALFFKNFGVWK